MIDVDPNRDRELPGNLACRLDVPPVASAQPATAKEAAPEAPKVEFDSAGRVGVSDKELLQKLGLPTDENAARFDMRIPDEVRVSGGTQNMVCLIPIPRK